MCVEVSLARNEPSVRGGQSLTKTIGIKVCGSFCQNLRNKISVTDFFTRIWGIARDKHQFKIGRILRRKFHNDLAGYPRQPRMPDKIPARGWKSQGKYPPRTTLPRTRHTSGRMICISELYTRQCRSIMIDYFLGTCRSYTTYVGQN